MKSFSSGEIAKICDVNPRTVIRWIEAKRLKAFKLPGRGNNRVAHQDLLTFLQQNNIPIPTDLLLEQESLCFIISRDKQLIRHSQRIARNAGFFTHLFAHGLTAGIEMAIQKPALIIVDADTSNLNALELGTTVSQGLKYQPYIIVFDDNADSKVSAHKNTKLFTLAKPVDNYAFAMVLDSIVDAEQEAIA